MSWNERPFARSAVDDRRAPAPPARNRRPVHAVLFAFIAEIATRADRMRRRLPFPLRGFDTDNNTVFMNETVRDYCVAEKIGFIRCRPYHKNDQAHVEPKNGEIVRRMVEYRRYEGVAAAEQLAKLYMLARLFVNALQPCFKLAEKTRNGAQVKKRYTSR